MDSVTQAVLGAAVGEAVLGKKIGRKAPLWGIIGGTIPDLDVFLNPFLSDIESLVIHRTFSHSIFLLTLFTPLIAYLVFTFYKKRARDKPYGNFPEWCKLFFLVFLTHILLDAFTNYGTMLLYPFFEHRFAWDTIFVIDPLYTIPLLISTIIIFVSKSVKRRKIWNIMGLSLSTAYLIFTCFNKLYVNNIVKNTLENQEINYEKFLTVPTPFNNVLWSVIVKSENGFYAGYYSLLDGNANIEFRYIDQNGKILNNFTDKNDRIAKEIQKLKSFSKGYYVVDNRERELIISDIRFGTISGWMEGEKDFIFSFGIKPTQNGKWAIRRHNSGEPSMDDLNRLIDRMLGEKKG